MDNSKTKLLGNIIIISAPSGAGKSSICKAVINSNQNILYSVSYTTRLPRNGEKNGKEYFFINKSTFEKMIKEKKFAEWAIVHSHYYGTPKVPLETLGINKNILLEIDVQGAMNIKKQYSNACMIFIMTPDLKTLKNRLVSRNKECNEIINLRLKNVKKELKYIYKYEYLVINKKLSSAIHAVKIIIESLHYKIQKTKNTSYQRRIKNDTK
ncbi:MAG: guanylate kinase [Endomicrobium sp.]|jgi:guanylate kinase|nr:guanylate kinase [Endomicrobium sp.]